MKRCAILILLLALAAPAAEALEWETKSNVIVKLFPGIEPEPGWVKANGFHNLLLTEVLVQDTYFPIRFRINQGQLSRSAVPQAVCSTPWIWADDALAVMCVTIEIDNPCENGWFQASTLGQLQGHPKGGWKQAVSGIETVDCECV